MDIIFSKVEEKIILVGKLAVILDSDVAILYGVPTKRINEAVKNNLDKFPKGYVIELDKEYKENLQSKKMTTNLAMTRVNPKAFTEKGLYMLATILKSKQATQTTIEIIETFTKIRALSRTLASLAETKGDIEQKNLMQKSGEIMADILGEDLKTIDTETSIEINFAVLKFKHTIKRKEDKGKK